MTEQSPLASALSVILAEDQAKSDLELKRTLAANISDDVKANNDANFARETLYNMILVSNDAVANLVRVAGESQSARHYEVLAQLINGNAIMSEKLLKVLQDKQVVQNNAINLIRNQGGQLPTGNVNIDKAVFVGTTNELLKMIKSTTVQQIIDAEIVAQPDIDE